MNTPPELSFEVQIVTICRLLKVTERFLSSLLSEDQLRFTGVTMVFICPTKRRLSKSLKFFFSNFSNHLCSITEFSAVYLYVQTIGAAVNLASAGVVFNAILLVQFSDKVNSHTICQKWSSFPKQRQ